MSAGQDPRDDPADMRGYAAQSVPGEPTATAVASGTEKQGGKSARASKSGRRGKKADRRRGLGAKIDALPLTTKLLSIVLLLLGVGLIVTAVATNSLVWEYLVNQTDEQLMRQSQLVVNSISALGSSSSSAPTDYFLQVRDDNGRIVSTPFMPRLRGGMVSKPVLPASGTNIPDSKLQVPTTVKGRLVQAGTGAGGHDPGQWRVVALRWINEQTGARGACHRPVAHQRDGHDPHIRQIFHHHLSAHLLHRRHGGRGFSSPLKSAPVA